MNKGAVKLKRSLGLFSFTFYGLGTIIGAGIYVLIGEVAAFAGPFLPASFLLAGIIAAFTVFSYAELACRFPYCAGEAIFVEEAWHHHFLSTIVGWLIVLTGTISAAAIVNGFVGYLNLFIESEASLAIPVLILVLAALASWGIRASAIAIFIITLIELAGLTYVVIFAYSVEPSVSSQAIYSSSPVYGFSGIFLGSFLAFYAFIGFEDMVNVIEEVKNPLRNFPIAIVLTLFISVSIYCLVSFAALRINSPQQLAESDAPLALLISTGGGNPAFIGLISLFAVINGGLVQIIMGSRVLYGMANRKMAPLFLSKLNVFTQTPVYSTLIVSSAVLLFALLLPLAQLAQLTSLIMLSIFIIINCALIVLKRKTKIALGSFTVPLWVPICGVLSAATLMAFQISTVVLKFL